MPSPRVVRRSLIGVGAALVMVLIIAVATGVTLVRRPYPAYDGVVSFQGLDHPVSIRRDAQGVPHIYAETTDDLFRAQGYVHAQDRFFEMDWRRHVTAGRVSELVGADPDALLADKVVRTLGWRRVAEAELEQADPATRRHLEAYSAGVNNYLSGRSAQKLSVAYTILGAGNELPSIEPWTPVDTLSWFKALAWQLRGNYDDELERARVFGTVRDVRRVDQLFPAYPYDRHQPILTGATTTAKAAAAAPNPATSKPAATKATSSSAASPKPSSRTTSTGKAQATTTGAGLAVVDDLLGDAAAQQAVQRAWQAVAAVPTGVAGGEGIGSNSWVVSGDLTSTGKPLLANDPHLAPSAPGVWYQVGLHCTKVTAECPFDVSGYGFSGMPGVMIGHTSRIAWGITNLGPDVTDLYLEKVEGASVERDGRQVALTRRTETIKVAGAAPVTVTIRTGPHGPLLSDVIPDLATAGARAPTGEGAPDRGAGYAVALAWTALAPGHDMDAVFAVNAATDFASFKAGVLKMDVPAQNFVYADVDGHIGYQAPGRIPIRSGAAGAGTATTSSAASSSAGSGVSATPEGSSGATPSSDATGSTTAGTAAPPTGGANGARGTKVPTDGTWPLPGWSSRYDWKGYVPAADLPGVLDPSEHFIVAANQAVTSPGGKVTFTSAFDYGYRSQRIRDLITAKTVGGGKLGVTDLEAIQNDTRNGIAPELVPLLLTTTVKDPFYAEAVALLKDWDYSQPTDSASAAYFNAVWANLLELTFSDEMPEGTRPDGGGRWYEVVRTLLKAPSDEWWDDRSTPSVVETRDEVLRQAVLQARDQLTMTLGKDPQQWEWGRLHQLELEQEPLGASSQTAALHWLLNLGPVEMPGGTSIVNATGWNAASGNFDVTWGPSMRMVVDLGALDSSRWVNQTGQSGHPGHPNYDDQLEAWAEGRTFAWPFSEQAVKAATEHTVTLQPATTSPSASGAG